MKNELITIHADDLTKIFPHPYDVKTNFTLFGKTSFSMTSEDLNFIIGSSGSGKSTLLRIIMGIENIDAGRIKFENEYIHNLTNLQKRTFLQNIGYIDQFPQNNLSLFLSPRENLKYSYLLKKKKKSKKYINQKIEELSGKLKIEELLDKSTLNLSGGELQRLSIACAMISEPKLLLCDEPTSQLDYENKIKVISALKILLKNFNSLIIITTHDLSIINSKKTYQIENGVVLKYQ